MTPNALRHSLVTFNVLASVCLFLALPGSAAARCLDAPGLRYPLIDWRSVNGGRLPQTHTYKMQEDTFEITIEDGTRQNLSPNEMTIVLTSAGTWMWRKEIAAIDIRPIAVSTAVTDVGNGGPSSMRIQRGTCASSSTGVRTIVFRKIDAFGWFMRDMYHFDIDHFWSTLGGKIVTIKWADDNHGDPQYPPKYVAPFVIPFDRNLAAVSWPMPSNLKRIDLFEILNGSLRHSWAAGAGWVDENAGASRFDDLGRGHISSGPTVSSSVHSYFDVFVRDSSSADRWNGVEWTSAGSLGLITSSPAAVSWGLNRIDLVARGTDFGLYHTVWDGSGWSSWNPLGGSLTSSPAIVSRGYNSLDVFARGTDNALWTRTWTGSTWSGWSSLGGILTSDPAAVVYGAGKMAVFARGADNALWVKVNSAGVWSGWSSLRGGLTSAPAATSSRPNQIDVFARGTDDQIYQISLQGSGWSDWSRVALPVCGSC